jgi:hypothetical protein
MRPTIVVEGGYPTKTLRGNLLGWLAFAFVFLWVFGIDAILRAIGLPNSERPFIVRVLLLGVAFVPFALWYLVLSRPALARQLGVIEALPIRALLAPASLVLVVGGERRPAIAWDAIAALERSDDTWRLVAIDGSTLATIPVWLMYPPPSWTDAPTFAELIVQMRPDRFALRGERFEPGMTEFALRRPDDVVGRPRRTIHRRVLTLGIALAIVAFVLLIATTPTG